MFMVSNTRFVRVFLGSSFKTLHMICQSSSTIVSKQALATKREKRRRKKKADQDYRNLVNFLLQCRHCHVWTCSLAILLQFHGNPKKKNQKNTVLWLLGFIFVHTKCLKKCLNKQFPIFCC